MSDDPIRIKVDIDRDRLLEIVDESLRIFVDYYGEDSGLDRGYVLSKVGEVLSSGMVSVMFIVPVPNRIMSDLSLRIDPRRRQILFLSNYKKKLAPLNQMIRNL